MSEHRALPWHKWYPADYLADRGLQACSIETEGAWSRTLNHMMHDGNGTLSDTIEGWARMWRVTPERAAGIVAEFKRYKIGVIADAGDEVVLTSQRVTTDLAARRAGTARVQKHRAKLKTEGVTEPKPKAKAKDDPLPLSDWKGVLDPVMATWLAKLGAEWKRNVHPNSNDPTIGSDDVTKIIKNMRRKAPLDSEGIERAVANAATEYADRPETMRPMLKQWLRSGDWRDFARADWAPSKPDDTDGKEKVGAVLQGMFTKREDQQTAGA